MPELPDVEVFRRYLESVAGGRRIESVEIRDERCLDDISAQELAAQVRGGVLGDTRRRGKQLFLRLNERLWLTLHFGMTGYLAFAAGAQTAESASVADPQAVERAERYGRAVFGLVGGGRLIYALPRLLGRLGLTEDPESFAEAHDLGPDARGLSGEAFRELLDDGRGGVKSLLMNQARLAGIGNVYSDEMLFHAHIHPGRKLPSLQEEERNALDQARVQVLDGAIAAQADPSQMPREWLIHHREEEARCPRCGAKIRREKISGRGSYFCEGHQA